MSPGRSSSLLVLLALFGVLSFAHAEESAGELGERLYNSGSYEQALSAFQAAYLKQPVPLYLYNIAQSLRSLGRAREAVAMYERYLRAEPETTLRDKVTSYVRELQARIDAQEKAPAPQQPAPAPPSVQTPSGASVTSARPPDGSTPQRAPATPGSLPALALTREPRPKWRITTGVILIGLGLGLTGVGAWAYSLTGHQMTGFDYDDSLNHPLGIAGLTGGAAMTATGIVLLAIPGQRRAASPSFAGGR